MKIIHDDKWAATAKARGVPYHVETVKTKGETRKILTGINEAFFAGLYVAHTDIVTDLDDDSMWSYDPREGIYLPITHEMLMGRIQSMMVQVSHTKWRETNMLKFVTGGRLHMMTRIARGFATIQSPWTTSETVHIQNGIIRFLPDLQGFEVIPFAPDIRAKKKVPFDYDPDAACPQFMRFLSRMMPSKAVLATQKYFGVVVTGRNTVQKLLALDGGGENGKTTLANIAGGLVGEGNCGELRTGLLGERFEMARYLGKSLLIGPDVKADFLSGPTATSLKAMIGGDAMNIEIKYSNSSNVCHGTWPIIITSNSRLKVRLEGDVHPWRRRLLLVRTRAATVPKAIENYHRVLLDCEGPGILNFALRGIQRIRRDFTRHGRFWVPMAMREDIDDLLAESDSLQYFLRKMVQATSFGDLTVEEITQAYVEFCRAREWKGQTTREVENDLYDAIKENFGVIRRNDIARNGHCRKGFRGIMLAPHPQEAEVPIF